MDGPHVTTVVPTYRRPALLKRAVESVLAQTYPRLRVLVCDNASGDETGEVIAALSRGDDRVVYHRHEENRGAYYNFQFGVDAVDTELFSILSDDDILLPDFYRRAVAALESDRSAGFYGAQSVMFDPRRGTHNLWPSREWSAGRHGAGTEVLRMVRSHFVWTSCVFRREVRDASGPFETIPMGDVLFLGKAAARFPFVVELVPGAVYTETGSNYSHTLPVSELNRSWEIARAWAESLAFRDAADRKEMLRILDRKLRVVAHGMLRNATETGDWTRFDETADYLLARGDLDRRRRARIAFARLGGRDSWRFKALGMWARLQSGYKRRRASGWRTMTVDEVVAHYR